MGFGLSNGPQFTLLGFSEQVIHWTLVGIPMGTVVRRLGIPKGTLLNDMHCHAANELCNELGRAAAGLIAYPAEKATLG